MTVDNVGWISYISYMIVIGMVVMISLMVIVLEWVIDSYPHSKFVRWWRRNICDRDPYD